MVFIAHCKKDRVEVLSIYNLLRRRGFAAWLDEKNLIAGQDWKLEIRKAIGASKAVLICLSSNWVSSRSFAHSEIQLALKILEEWPKGKIYIIPVRLDPCEVPDNLDHLHWINVFEPDGRKKLLASVKAAHPVAATKLSFDGAAGAPKSETDDQGIVSNVLEAATTYTSNQIIPGFGKFIDPDGDCTLKMQASTVIIKVPGTLHDLGPVHMHMDNAPRILQTAEDDFILTVKISGTFEPGAQRAVSAKSHPYHGAGLVVWDTATHLLRVERGVWVANGQNHSCTPVIEYRKNDELLGTPNYANGQQFSTHNPVYLRIQRVGDKCTTAASLDGIQFLEIGAIATMLPRKVLIGVTAINSSKRPFTVEFSDFRLSVVTLSMHS